MMLFLITLAVLLIVNVLLLIFSVNRLSEKATVITEDENLLNGDAKVNTTKPLYELPEYSKAV